MREVQTHSTPALDDEMQDVGMQADVHDTQTRAGHLACLREALTKEQQAKWWPLIEKEIRFITGEPLETFPEFSSTSGPRTNMEQSALP